MPSFLSKVFGRKKDDKDSSPTNQLGPGELLGGKFEAISPNVSPSAAHFLELHSDIAKVPADADSGRIINEKDFGLPFFRTKSRPSSPEVKPKRLFDNLPPLSLDFDLKDKSAYNGYIFEESNSEAVFSDNVLGQRRLNPVETLVLVRACSKAIISRGLETLGIMTPHWYSASPEVQRRLISNFLRSLDLTNSTADAPISQYITNFEDEVNFTRSIHDIAAVLRWGLRHVQLEGDSFGTNDGWYKAFLDAEATNDYPPKAFSEKLAPSLPASHLNLVSSTLEVFSSLAAFSEANSTSGSKLSKIFGLWLLTARRIEEKDDWRTFYARWERTGRMLEHLFLARIRDQSTDQRLPTRLLELVHKYPFTHGLSPPTTDLQLLPYPQFTTALHSALYVRVQYEVTSQERIPKTKINPSVLLADAFSTKVEEGEFVELWAKITSAASKAGSELPLGNVLSNESLRLLSLVADRSKEEFKSPTFSVISLVEPRLQRAASNGASSFSPIKPGIESVPLTTTGLSPIGSDWDQLSASGFLDVDQKFPPLVSTLFDTDVEKTEPRDIPLPISRKSSKRAHRRSVELPRSVFIAESSGDSSPYATNPKSSSKARQEAITASQLELIELDEAFVDFWSDAFLDPIASDWPAFVICKLNPALVPHLTFGTGDETTKKTVKWLVLEQVYSVKPHPIPSLPPMPLSTSAEPSARPASPIAQTPTGRRLFNFWSVSRTPSSSSTGSQKTKKTPKTPKVGEMGELIEEDDSKKDVIRVKTPGSKKFKSLPGVKRSFGKTSDEKARSVDMTRPEISNINAGATSSTIVAENALAAAGAAAVASTAVRLPTEKQEGDMVKDLGLSTVPEAVAESSEPISISEFTDDAPKQDVIPVEAEVALPGVEEAGVATSHAAVPEPQIIDTGAAEPVIPSSPETTIVADEPQAEEPSKEEGGTTIEEDVSRGHQEVDQLFLGSAASTSAESSYHHRLLPEVELSVRDREVEQTESISSTVGEPDQPVLGEVNVASEVPLMPEDEPVEIFGASGEELGGVSEKSEPQSGQESAIESLGEATTTALPEAETQVTETDTKTNEPVEELNEEVPPVEIKPEPLPVADEISTTIVEEVGIETSFPTSSVAEPAPTIDEPIVYEAHAVEAYPELDESGPPVEEVTKFVAVTPTEVDPSVGDATKEARGTVEEMEADDSFVDDVPAHGDSSSAIIDPVEEVFPATETSAAFDAPPISNDISTPTQAVEELLVGGEIAVPEEGSGHSLEIERAATVEVPQVVEADAVVGTISEDVGAGTSAEQAMDEFQAPEAPVEAAVEEAEPSVDAPVHELSVYEAEPAIVTAQETTEKLSSELEALDQTPTEHANIVEGGLAVEIGVEESTAVGETPADEGATVVEEHDQETRALEPGIPETQEAITDEVPVAGGSHNDASEDVLPVEAILQNTLAVEPEPEVPPPEPTTETSEQAIITSSEESATEGVPAAEEPSYELPVFKEEIPTELETEETPSFESPTEELHEEPAVETKLSEELPATEPELPIEEPEVALGEAPIEVLQVVEEPDATNEALLAEDAPFAEGAVLNVPEREVILSTSEVPGAGDASMPEDETPSEAPERVEESLEPALPTSEDVPVDNFPSVDPPPIAEVTPPAEEAEGIPVASVEVAEESPVGGEGIGVERTAETTTEIKESDALAENVTASVPEVSEESPFAEEVIPVTTEEPVPSHITEPALGEFSSEAQGAPMPDIPEAIEDAPAIVEEVDEAVNAEELNSLAESPLGVDEPPADAPEQPKHVSADEASPTPIDTTPVQEQLLTETSTVAQALPTTIEETILGESMATSGEPVDAGTSSAAEQPSTFEQSSPADAERNTLPEASIPLDEGVSPLVDEVVPVPEEESPTRVEDTFAVVPDEVPAPVEEMPPVIHNDAEHPITLADEALASGPEVGLQLEPDVETVTEPPEISSASEQPVETLERGDGTSAIGGDQAIHSEEVEQAAVEGGPIVEPMVEPAARDDLSLEKPDEESIPDAPVARSTTDIPAEEELALVDNRNKAADATANTLDPIITGTTSISENGPFETPTEKASSSIIGPSSVVELDIVPVSLEEPSPESGDPVPTGQSDRLAEDTNELPAIPEHIDAKEPTILDEVDEVPTFVEESRAVAEPSEEPAVALLEEPELASELPNGVGHIQTATDSPPVDVDDATSEPLEVNIALENGNAATDVEATHEVTLAEAE